MSNEMMLQDKEMDFMSPDKLELIRKTICKDATNDELQLFFHACKKNGLDPLMKQIYFVKRGGKGTIQMGIDGYRLIADRTGRYSPGPEPTFTYDKEGKLVSATAHVKKMSVDGTWHTASATAFYDEYKPAYSSDFWTNKPHIMLSKCAEALALRKAFPKELSGTYVKEEMGNKSLDSEEEESLDSTTMEVVAQPVAEMIPRDDIIKTLIQKTGLPEDKFLEYITSLEKRCLDKRISFYDVIKNSLGDMSGIVKGYKDWLAHMNPKAIHVC